MSQQSETRPKSNTVAVIGLVLAVPVWPLGAILSLIGLVRAGRLGGGGRTLGIVGLVLSLLVGTGSIAFLALNRHKSVDPGCVTAEAGVAAFRKSVLTYEAAVQTDQADGNTALVDNDVYGLINNLISAGGVVDKAGSAATTADLQSAETALSTDMSSVVLGYQALQQGDTSQTTKTETANAAALNDAAKIDGLCK